MEEQKGYLLYGYYERFVKTLRQNDFKLDEYKRIKSKRKISGLTTSVPLGIMLDRGYLIVYSGLFEKGNKENRVINREISRLAKLAEEFEF